MSSSVFDRRQVLKGALASAVPLALGACAGDKSAREPLVVGGLPVTCNLTLPVACVAKDTSISSSSTASTAAGPRSRSR
jgi:NitT/TauT family transport system substrate-binding protein